MRVCALLGLLAAFGLAALVWWDLPSGRPPTAGSCDPAVVERRESSIGTPSALQPQAWNFRPGHRWGGALNSAEAGGNGFFDARRAAQFAAAVSPEFRKYVVELNARAFLPLAGKEPAGEVLADATAPLAVYLQFSEHPRPEQRAQLAVQGVELLSYVSGYAWTARGRAAAFRTALQLDFVRAIARIDPRDKLHAQVFGMAHGTPGPSYALAPDGRTRFRLLTAPGTTRELLLQQFDALVDLELAPADVSRAPASVLGPRFEVVARNGLAQQVAEAAAVAFVELVPPPAASRDATTDEQSNITDVRDYPPYLNGLGVKVAVRELGNIDAHADFASRLQRVDADGVTDALNVDHATGVTGQIGSAGVAQPAAKGVAPAVSMLGYVVGVDPDTFATADIIDAAAKGARLSNHSYGPVDPTFGDYQTMSADWDDALRAHNLVGAFAQYEGSPFNQYKRTDYFVGAKNTVCVGATSALAHAGDSTASPPVPAADGLAYFAQYGPMNDGRVKPDLVAYGDDQSLDRGTTGVQTNRGTSFATPVVTGVAALVFQAHKALTGAEPSAQLTKALLCNSATDLGAPGPDAQYGFGLVNAEAAMGTIALRASASSSPFLEGTVTNGGTMVFSASLQNAPELKATLCWLDPAGNPAAAKALVNDLDLEILDPNGVLHYPFSLDPANPAAAATSTSRNTVDPLEQLVVANPANGQWTIRVKGTSIPQGDQAFAVCLNWPTQPVPLAAAIAASPESGGAPLDVSFTGRFSTGTIVRYMWDFGDGSSGEGADVTHTYANAGVYTVSLAVKDAQGGQAEAAPKTITVERGLVNAFPSRARAKFNFVTGLDDLQFVMTAPALVHTPQQAREAYRDGTFEGGTYTLQVGGVAVKGASGQPVTMILNRRASFKAEGLDFRLNLVRGQLSGRVKGLALAKALGITNGTTTPVIQITVEVVGASTIYRATYALSYKSNGQVASGRSR